MRRQQRLGAELRRKYKPSKEGDFFPPIRTGKGRVGTQVHLQIELQEVKKCF